MGAKHSTLAPSDGDFAVARPCKALPLPSTTSSSRRGRTFYIPRNVWNHVNGRTDDGIAIRSLDGIRFIPVVAIVDGQNNTGSSRSSKKGKKVNMGSRLCEKSDLSAIQNSTADRCLVEDSNGNLIAVLVAGHRKVQICSLSPPDRPPAPSSSSSRNLTHPDGRRLYERGVVKMHFKNGTVTRDYDLVTPEDGVFTTKFYGKATSSKRNMALTDGQNHLVAALCHVDDNVEEKALGSKVSVRRDDMSVWKCQTCPGVDDVMIACLAVGLDKLKVLYKEEMRQATYQSL